MVLNFYNNVRPIGNCSKKKDHMNTMDKAIKILGPMISEARRRKIESVVSSRTHSVGVLLENVHDKGNENAILRSMDAFGFLNLHRLRSDEAGTKEERKTWITQMRTDAGASHWVNVTNWSSTTECVQHLKEKCGYRIACTCPDSPVMISDIDFCQKLVIAFGNERKGISELLLEHADISFSIPMVGFVESFNVSVSVALSLYHAYCQRTKKMVR